MKLGRKTHGVGVCSESQDAANVLESLARSEGGRLSSEDDDDGDRLPPFRDLLSTREELRRVEDKSTSQVTMAFRTTAATARRTASSLTKSAQRGLKTSSLSPRTQLGGVRSLQQAVREPLVDVQAMSPMPLTMLTEEETMFKDSGTLFVYAGSYIDRTQNVCALQSPSLQPM